MEYVTGDQMAKIDQLARQKYGVNVVDMMEEAGRYLAELVVSLRSENIVIFFGGGMSAGGGLVAARHLLNHNLSIQIVSATEDISMETSLELDRLRMLGIPLVEDFNINKKTIIIDSLIGYGLEENPTGSIAKYIEKINEARKKGARVVSLDIPSGINSTTGELYTPHVVADYTVTLSLPKAGLKNAKRSVGKVFLANVGIPFEVYTELGINVKEKEVNISKLVHV